MKNQRIRPIVTIFLVAAVLTIGLPIIVGMKSGKIPVRDVRIHMTLLDNGDALMEEWWDITPKKGKEMYLERFDLGVTDITDFHVTDNGNPMKEIPDWKENRQEDVPCCGLADLGYEDYHQYELCWHIDGYKRHVYEISYTYKNFITKYTDGSGFYHTFFMAKNFWPSHISLTISGEGIDFEGAEAATYGFAGTAGFRKGVYRAKSFGKVVSDQYLRTVMTFPEGTFHDLVKEANKDFAWRTRAGYMSYADMFSENRTYGTVRWLLSILVFPVAAVILVVLIISVSRREQRIAARNLSDMTLEESLECYQRHRGILSWLTPLHLSVYALYACVIIGMWRVDPGSRILGYVFFGGAFFLTLIFLMPFNSSIMGKPKNTGRIVRIADVGSSGNTSEGIALLNQLTLEEAWILFVILGDQKIQMMSIVGAYFAKWSALGLVEKEESGDYYSEQYRFTQNASELTYRAVQMTTPERELYEFFKSAGDSVDVAAIEKICRKHYKRYIRWVDSTKKDAYTSLQEKGWLDGLYYEDCWWDVSNEPVFTEEGAKIAAGIRAFIDVCADAPALAKLLSGCGEEEAVHLIACAGFIDDISKIVEQIEYLPWQIEKERMRIWMAASIGSQFGIMAARGGFSAAVSAGSGSSSGGSSGGGSSGGSSGGGSSGGGGGGIR